jgi:predicted RNA binding protein YcfA (HicA-like mRNA interferase family)
MPMPLKVGEVLKMLHDDGWYFVAMRGSHRQLRHGTKPGRVTVHGKPSDTIAPGTPRSILRQSGLKK